MLLLLVVLTAGQAAAPPPVSEALRIRVEQVHDGHLTAIRGARLMEADAVAHFFEARSFAPAWDASASFDILRAIARSSTMA